MLHFIAAPFPAKSLAKTTTPIKAAAMALSVLAILPSLGHAAASPLTKQYQGIYNLPSGEMLGQTVDLSNSTIAPLWQASYISGMALRNVWAVIQTSKGVYDWSFFDQGLSLAQQNHKMISLSVAAGAFSPSWLINEGAASINITVQPNFSSQPQQLKMVLPWDPIFQTEWLSFVQAMAARYDGSPNVAYVYIGGPGVYIETYVVQNQQDYDAFNAAGGLPAWIQGSEAVIDMYGSAFIKTPFFLAVANPVNQIPSQQAAGQAAVEQVINYGLAKYPGRFGIANDGLNDTSATNGLSFFANQIISQNSGTSPVGFQMVSAATNNGSTSSVGNLTTAVNAGIDLGGHYIEVYQSDCLNPQYTQMLAQANSELLASTSTNAVPPMITSQPQSTTVTSGSRFSLSVTATGSSTLVYQWSLNGTQIAGASSSTYSVSSAAAADAGTYTVLVTNSGGAATSNAATVTVSAAAAAVPAASGGGGGALSYWFYVALAALVAAQKIVFREAKRNAENQNGSGCRY
jgi:hypothetical protein